VDDAITYKISITISEALVIMLLHLSSLLIGLGVW